MVRPVRGEWLPVGLAPFRWARGWSEYRFREHDVAVREVLFPLSGLDDSGRVLEARQGVRQGVKSDRGRLAPTDQGAGCGQLMRTRCASRA